MTDISPETSISGAHLVSMGFLADSSSSNGHKLGEHPKPLSSEENVCKPLDSPKEIAEMT